MKKYEKEVLKSQMDSEDKALKEVREIFTKSKQDVKDKIAQLNARTDTENLQSIIYQRQYQEMILGQIESTLDELNSGQYKTVDSFLHESYEEGYLGTMYSLQQQGVPMVMPINDKKVYEALVTDTKLSKKYYGANPLKGRLQENVDLLKTRIRTNLSRGIASGMSWVQVASNIASGMNNPFDVAMRDSMRIVRTEGRRVNEKASLDVALEARDKGADLVKIWDATLDGRTRPWHREADGQIRELDDDFLVMGEHLKAPLQGGSARNVINCRCFAKHTPRWALDGGSTKYDGFTDQLLTFDSPDDYAKFKELYWSEDNVAYMKYVSQLEDKYGTKDTKKLLSLMSDREYHRYKTLENNSPFWNGQIDDFFNKTKIEEEDVYDELAKIGGLAYPKKHQEAIKTMLNNAPADTRRAWNAVCSDMHSMTGADYKAMTGKNATGAFYSPYCNAVYCGVSSASKGSSFQTPYQVIFHEYGHNMDYILNKLYGTGEKKPFSVTYGNGVFVDTLTREAETVFSNFAFDNGFFEVLTDDNMSRLFHSLPADVSLKYPSMSEWFTQNKGTRIINYSKARSEFCNQMKNNHSLLDRTDISDMFEPVVKVQFPFGTGHGLQYWGSSLDRGTEAFAEIYSAKVANQGSWETIQKYFPESVKIFEEMLGVVK